MQEDYGVWRVCELVRGQGLCLGPVGSFPKNREEEPWHVDFILNTMPFCFTLNVGVNDCEDLFGPP